MKALFKVLLSTVALSLSTLAAAAPKGEVLVVLSSETALPLRDGKTFPSGYYLNEFGVPADALQRAGYRLTVVTPRGNRPQADQRSVDPQYFRGDAQEMKRIAGVVDQLTQPNQVHSLPEVIKGGLDRYAAVFIPGGHAPMIDLANNPLVGQVLRHFHAQGKPTAAICHGPITLLAAQDDPQGYEQALGEANTGPARNWIYSGYRMTIFADAEEAVFEASLNGDKLRYYPARAMATAGGDMRFAKAWEPHVVVDRELITGQNPFSDQALAQALIAALAKR
ncbi:type 1 glutamine amidotransferase domain-containing protein [Roseateles depolymerans]|uniref:Thiamine biosynthesis protein ThiJ n=1 Tax=Roseateles depolymerans TaxID=76731 RepID=A0A0U3CV32_9BURK|nr:type 1 glutamine amidotransferase domain-containing protein [Roseateles depolymerans]ALV05174.1 thiamine biosynthesis protein ThiJ [Roseateles depolymerans]REG14810.1 putative intracellular protease/amidase [Roseateles depolymerans]